MGVINDKVNNLNALIDHERSVKDFEVNELNSALANDVPQLQDQVQTTNSTSHSQHKVFND